MKLLSFQNLVFSDKHGGFFVYKMFFVGKYQKLFGWELACLSAPEVRKYKKLIFSENIRNFFLPARPNQCLTQSVRKYFFYFTACQHPS